MIIIVAAIAGVTRLALQQRREQKMHILDDFRTSLERLSSPPLPAQGRAPSTARKVKRSIGSLKRSSSSPRGEWDRIAPYEGSGLLVEEKPRARSTADMFFAPEVTAHQIDAPAEEVVERRPASRRRKQRTPLLAGRLWRKPREPWLWTYSKPRRPSSADSDVSYVDFGTREDVVYASEGNLAHSSRPFGSRSPHSVPAFAGPHDSVRRATSEHSGRDAYARRQEARRRTGARLS